MEGVVFKLAFTFANSCIWQKQVTFTVVTRLSRVLADIQYSLQYLGTDFLNFRAQAAVALAMAQMTEDDIYRTSTQYRLWSFTRESLASLRSATNASAADGVRAAIRSQRTAQNQNELAKNGNNEQLPDAAKEVDCLTVEEEQKLVGFYCVKAMQFADFCEFPTNVKVIQTHSTNH